MLIVTEKLQVRTLARDLDEIADKVGMVGIDEIQCFVGGGCDRLELINREHLHLSYAASICN